MHQARAVIGGGVVGQIHRRETLVAVAAVFIGDVIQGVFEIDQPQVFAQGGGQHRAGQTIAAHAFFNQSLGQHQETLFGFHQGVGQLGVEVQGLVGRDRPGGGGPDDGKSWLGEGLQAKGRCQLVRLSAFKGHIQRGAFFVLVLNLKFCERRAAIKAPVHRLQATVDKAALHDAFERADFIGLVAEIHGAVRVVPLAQHAQALEVGHLADDLLGGKGAAFRLHLVAWKVAPV